jgi:hypothetical protein
MSAPETATALGDVFPDGESRATHPARGGVSVASKGPRLVAGGLLFTGIWRIWRLLWPRPGRGCVPHRTGAMRAYENSEQGKFRECTF